MSKCVCGATATGKFCTQCGRKVGDAPAPAAQPAVGVRVVAKGTTSEFREPSRTRNSALDYAGKRGEDEIVRIREQRAAEDAAKAKQMQQELAWRGQYDGHPTH